MYFVVLPKSKLKKIFICIIALVMCSVFSFGIYQVATVAKVKKLPIYKVKTDEKVLSISFDCAWGVDYTDKLLSIMEAEDVKCTFFMVEFWTKKYPGYVKKISEQGHETGTHTATHPYMSKLDKTAITKELNSSVKAIEDITSKKVEVFRPPYGDYDDLVIDTAKELGLYTIQWSVDSLDWKNLSASEIQKRVLSKAEPGSIILFHNQGLHTAEALPFIIKTLKEKGYKFVPVGQLIYRDNYSVTADGTQVKSF